jgi:hypothetical protein
MNRKDAKLASSRGSSSGTSTGGLQRKLEEALRANAALQTQFATLEKKLKKHSSKGDGGKCLVLVVDVVWNGIDEDGCMYGS